MHVQQENKGLKQKMELTSEAQFHLRNFSPHRLTYLPQLGAVLATDSSGRAKCIDVVTGAQLHPPAVEVPPSESGRCPPPVHFALHPETSKLVVASGNRLGARTSENGSILMGTILQTPVVNPQDEVTLEVPMEQVLSILKDLQIMIYVVIPELLRAIRNIQVQLEKTGPMLNLKHQKCATAKFTGKAQHLCDSFKELANKLKSSIPPTSVNHARTFIMALPCLPILSAWQVRMQLLLPESHGKVLKFESATELPTMDTKMMHVEGVRKLTLVNWPHKEYEWAVPKKMAEAGFYHLAHAHGSQASISSGKGDRVSCFACKMYLYSWEPTDEPWSEHERHTGGCPFVRGDYTENVPTTTTEATHPAVECSEKGDSAVCISSTGMGTGLVAVGTERGHISIWELDRGLLIMKHCQCDIKIVNGLVETTDQSEDKPSTGETAKLSEVTVGEKESPQVSVTVEVRPAVEEKQETIKEEGVKDTPTDATPTSATPPGDDEVVKSKLSATDQSKVALSDDPSDNQQPTRKQNFHITALSILSPPPPKEDHAPSPSAVGTTMTTGAAETSADKKPSSSAAEKPSTKQTPSSPLPTPPLVISPSLVSAVSVTNGGRCTPTLLVYSIKSNRPLDKGKSDHKVKPPMPPPPDPLDYDPWEPIELAPSYMGNMQPSSSTSSVLDVLSETKQDANAHPADLKYIHSIPLEEFSCGVDSGTMPEITELVPLAGGQLLAVLCSMSSTSPLLAGDGNSSANDDTSLQGGVLLFRTSIEEDGDRMRLRVDETPVSVVRFTDRSSTVVSMCLVTAAKKSREETKSSSKEEERREDILLATVSRKGDVVVYDCAALEMNAIGHYSCHSDLKSHDLYRQSHDQTSESCDSKPVECVSCTYCPPTYHLAVADSSGHVTLLSLRELLLARERLREVEDEETAQNQAAAFTSRPLTSDDLDQLLLPTRTSPNGVPYSLSLPSHWREIKYFQLHRQSPVHLHLGEGKKVTTRVWQHQPPSMEYYREDRYVFELVPESASTTPIGCVNVEVTIANRRSINDLATVTLLAPKMEPPPSFSYQVLNWKPYDILCGPINIKPLIDVTEQSIQFSLFHPFLVTRRPRVLWLELKDFFAPEYNDISVMNDNSLTAPKRSGWRAGSHRLRQNDSKVKPIPVQCTFSVTLHPTASPLDALPSMTVKPGTLFKLVSDPEFMCHVTLAVCGYRVEEKELASLPESLTGLLKEGVSVSTVDSQFKALELLSWMVGVHLTNANSGGYSLISSTISQVLTSLLHACFIRGNRSLVHKCARLVIMLYRARGRDDNRSDFRYSLNNALVQLLPLLPLASSAACIHFFLRLVATLTESCDSHMISRLCLTLLVELTKQLNSRSTFASQLLQTHFKNDGHVFEPELFDIYLSYCQKSTSIVKAPPKYTGSYLDVDYDYYGLFQPEPILPTVNQLPSDWSHIDPNSSTIVAASASAAADSSTLQVIADKGGHTIYDMELQLLLDCSKKTKAQAVKAIDEYSTFKHGSFLLYSQRGLLETLPIHYQCISVSGDASVQEANVHTLPTVPEGAPAASSAAPVIAFSKTMGYRFPANTGETGGRKADKPTGTSSSSTAAAPPASSSSSSSSAGVNGRPPIKIIPRVLADILVSAKELVMQIQSLKSGLAYSAILKFPHPIYLTDISIPAAVYMSSVSVDVWLEEGGEKDSVRVAHSSEIKERSMILGNLMPAPLCQYAKVTFVGRLGANREKAQVFIGSFYGRPIFTGESSVPEHQLISLEEVILAQYHACREKLSQALLSYAGLSRKSSPDGQKQIKQCEEKVASSYQECFKAQVQLARLRHFNKSQKDQQATVDSDKEGGGSDNGGVFSVDEEARSLNFQDMTFSRLSKIVGCLVDALLVLNGGAYTAAEVQASPPVRRKPFQRTICFDPEPPKFEDKIIDEFLEWSPVAPPSLSQGECSLLFLALCIHGVPKLHARACALLTRLCGSQEWWGRFITDMALELFNINQPGVFNKERALLQLSILSQRTYDVSNVIECLLQLLEEKLTQLIEQSSSSGQKGGGDNSFDHTLLQWIIILLSHILASIATQNQPKGHTNLFVPLPLLPSSLVLSLTQPKEEIDGESRRAELAERRRDLKRMLTTLGQKIEFASAEEKVKLKEEFDAIFLEYQSLRKQLLAHHRFMRQQRNAAAAAAKKPKSSNQKDKEKEKQEKEQQNEEDLVKPLDPDPALSSLPEMLCQNVARGLVHYISVLTSGDNWDFLPVACKSLSQMVALTCWSYPLHSLVSQEQVNSLVAFSCQHVTSPLSMSAPGSLEWGQRAVRCLLTDILHHGEIKPYFTSLNQQDDIEEVLGIKPNSPPSLSTLAKVVLAEAQKEKDKEEEVKLPLHDEQELKKMEKMFNKAPLEVPQILLSCGEVEIPLNRRSWKGRKGMEEWEKKKIKQEKESVTKDLAIQEDEGSITTEGGEAKMTNMDSEKTTTVNKSFAAKADVSAVSSQPRIAPKENAVVKAGDFDSVGGLSVSDLKRYLRHTYLQGDFEHMVDFPPPEKHSYGLALHNPLPVSISPSPYLSYIISNTFDYRVLSSLEVSAEHELQQLAKKVYESVLHSLLHARPTPDSGNETLSGEVSPVVLATDSLTDLGCKPFTVSTAMLTFAVEKLLAKALTPQSNLDVISVLEFCSDINSLLPVSSPYLYKPWRPEYTTKELKEVSAFSIPPRGFQLAIGNKKRPNKRYPFVIGPVSSNGILSLLFDCLLGTQNPSSKMWQIAISVLHTSLRYLWIFVAERQKAIDIDCDQLIAVLMKLFSSRLDAVELSDRSVVLMLCDFIVMRIPRRDGGEGKWYGIHLLLELMIKILEKRETSCLDSTLLLELVDVLSRKTHLLCLFSCEETFLYEVVGLIKKLTVCIVDLLPDFLEQASHSYVILYGGEQDEEHRRYRYIRSSGQDTKVRWIPVASESSQRNRVAGELIQLMREVLMLRVPDTVHGPVEVYCRDSSIQQAREERGDTVGLEKQERVLPKLMSPSDYPEKKDRVFLKLSPPDYPNLSLLYSDVQLMTTVLKLLSRTLTYRNEVPPPPTGKPAKTELDPTMLQSLFANFVRYLDCHCQDHSCLFEPILRALRSTSSELQMSKTFMSVVSRLASEFGSESSKEKLMNFVSEGGAQLALECFINGCKQTSPSIRRGILTQSINKLGQKDTLKPFTSGAHHVNFFPLATVRLKPNRTSIKELQTSSTSDHPTRTACFNHAYQGDEEWLRMQISLPYPILLHTVQFLQPMGMFQSGPSAVFIECGTQGTLSAPTPVTPLLKTSGLPCVKIEFKQPPVASEVVIHFCSPHVSNSLALSHMQVLGTGFGSSTKSDSSSGAYGTGDRLGSDAQSSTGWLVIIDQWMSLSKEISDKVLSVSTSIPDFLSATLSLLQHQDTLSPKSCNQLKRLLVAMAMYSQDYGTAIVQHLLGFSPGERMTGSPSQGAVPITTMTLDLLHQLCVPTSEANRQRLQLALRLLSNVPLAEGSVSHHLPTLIRVLSSTVWEGGKLTSQYDEGIFNSLAEQAFSLAVTSALKSSLNSLLCSLCYCVSDYFISLLSSCSHLLQSDSDNKTKLLHTLAHVAKSEECTSILLRSDLMSEVSTQLFDGFDQLLRAAKRANPEAESKASTDQSSDTLDMRTLLTNLCNLLAFLTDFVRNWTPGKDWMALEENCRFWPLMVELFSMDMACITKAVQDSSTSSVLVFEFSFCQKVVLEYFSACLSNHKESKRAFVRLVCNSINGAYGFDAVVVETESDSISESRNEPVLTPFLHNLLLELVVKPETIPVVLKFIEDRNEELLNKPLSSLLSSLSPTPIHECVSFHPSYPVGSTCYLLELSPLSTLSKLASLFNPSTESKAVPLKPKKEPAAPSSGSTLSSLKLPLSRKAKPPPAPPSSHSIEINSFELKKWLLPGSSFNPPQDEEDASNDSTSKVELVLPFNPDMMLEEKSTFGGLLNKTREVKGKDSGPALVLQLQKNDLLVLANKSDKRPSLSVASSDESILSLFVSEGGLRSLSHCLPSLYRYQWPEKTIGLPAVQLSSAEEQVTKKLSLFMSQVLLHPPNILPFHSILMLGLCLRVENFDATLSQNLAMIFVMMRLVLGAELEDLPHALSHHLCFLPYLVLLETLRALPTHTPEGCNLRRQLLEVGVVHHTLQCLSSAGHHSPRVDSGETTSTEPMQMGGRSSKVHRPKVTTSSDHHYWAKGTGFGTGSTASNWNLEALTAKQKSEEKYVCICLSILAEFLSLGTTDETTGGSDTAPVKGEGGDAVTSEESGPAVVKELPDYCTLELAELLSDSCLLPAMASYLLNDSVLDISKHIELYQSMLDLLSSIVVHPTLCHLLRLPVFSSDNGSSGDETTLASLIAKLRDITKLYQKTAKAKQPKTKKSMILHTDVPLSMLLTSFYTYKKPPKDSKPKPVAAARSTSQVVPTVDTKKGVAGEKKKDEKDEPVKPADQDVKSEDTSTDQPDKPVEQENKPICEQNKSTEQPDKPAEPAEDEEKEKDSSKEASDLAKPADETPPSAPPPRIPPRTHKPRSDVTDLATLVKKILSVSERVAKVVSELKRKEGSYGRQGSVSTPIAESAPASFDFYMKAMKPLQFDTYQILEESEYGTIRFEVPFHFHSRVQSATSSTQNAARSRRLAQEVATLSTSLPLSPSSSVFVRCDEERLDVMKVLITGPSETPYANGCFEFDVFFPPEYPKSPMLVHMRTTGQGRVRFNPNLYNDGKVCLSVLNTWHGRPEEKWNPQNSSFLQVLVSIQSLILVPEPYFNEPGYEQYRGTPFGDQKSLAYNANIYASTVQWAMVDAIKNPSPCFKEVVLQHFYLHKSKVLEECEEWKKQLVEGISKMQESGAVVNHIKEYLRLLAKATEMLKVELEKIKPEDFQKDGEEEEAETS